MPRNVGSTYETYKRTAHAAAIVAYGTSAVSSTAVTATTQIAGAGER